MPSNLPKIVFLAGINHENGKATKYTGEKYRQFREAYGQLFELFATRSAQVYFAELDQLSSDGTLSAYYSVEAVTDETIVLAKETGPLTPDVIINRLKDALYHHPAAKMHSCKLYNEFEVAQYGDKATSQQHLADYMPESLAVTAASVDSSLIDDFFARHAIGVNKPLRMNGGRGIELLRTAQEVRDHYAAAGDSVLQEFVETSEGVPGLVDGRHDVRLYVIDGRVQMMAVRQPRAGDFLANTAAGGSISFYGSDAVPAELEQLNEAILSRLSLKTPHYFISLDYFYGNGRWYLIEVNDQPGVPADYQTSEAAALHDRLVSSIMEYIS